MKEVAKNFMHYHQYFIISIVITIIIVINMVIIVVVIAVLINVVCDSLRRAV